MLFTYAKSMIAEAKKRGIKTDKNEQNLAALRARNLEKWGKEFPRWLQDPEFSDRIITTHKANLYMKDPEYYHPFKMATISKDNKPCCSTCNYFWITHVKKDA